MSSTPTQPEAPSAGALSRLIAALSSWRTASVLILGFSSGMPLGLVWIALPDWMRSNGVDVRWVGLMTLAQAPWIIKLLWAPLMDRYPLPWLGRRRGWIAVTQIALIVAMLAMAGLVDDPETPWVLLAIAMAIAFASASQDIVYDAFTVDLLSPDEKALVGGMRIATYRVAMFVAGAMSITLTAFISWSWVCVLQALLYLPMLWTTIRAPERPAAPGSPQNLIDAIWKPFLGMLSRHRALEILAFVIFYKLADNLSQSLLRPFLVDMGFSEIDRGVALGTIGLLATILGTTLGGALSASIGVGHILWIGGFLQIFSNVGYILVIHSGTNRVVMYAAMGFEHFTTGLGMGAFATLLLLLTQKRFSATQYALLSSLFALPRVVAGPVTGYTVYAFGWEWFFWMTMAAGIPGLLLLARFVPPGTRDPRFEDESRRGGRPLPRRVVVALGAAGTVIGAALAIGTLMLLRWLDALGSAEAGPVWWSVEGLLGASWVDASLTVVGVLLFSLVTGFLVAAYAVARRRPAVRE